MAILRRRNFVEFLIKFLEEWLEEFPTAIMADFAEKPSLTLEKLQLTARFFLEIFQEGFWRNFRKNYK